MIMKQLEIFFMLFNLKEKDEGTDLTNNLILIAAPKSKSMDKDLDPDWVIYYHHKKTSHSRNSTTTQPPKVLQVKC